MRTDYQYNAAGWLELVIDPRGIASRTEYDHLGRTIRTIAAYVDGIPSDNDDRTTEYTYDGNSNLLTVKAWSSATTYQTTQYVYEARIATGSAIDSNDLLSAMRYPDKTTGLPSTSEQETYTVNALGERTRFTDRNGTTHEYRYDVLGRRTADIVTVLGAGVDGAVRRLDVAYDTQGNPFLLTSYNAPSPLGGEGWGEGEIVNQVLRQFNGTCLP